MKLLLTIFIFLAGFSILAQETKPISPIIEVDSLYREDQFYINFAFANIQNKPKSFKLTKISPSISLGFIRDFPLNKNRTVAIALGLGYTFTKLNENISINTITNIPQYSIISGQQFDKNKLLLHYIDIPLEIRWRTSTPESHVFWRIYSGFKVSYLIDDRYKFKDASTDSNTSKNTDLNKLQYGAYIAAGRNTWNFYAYYGITPLFKSSAKINNETIGLNVFNMGLMFYIL